MVPSILQFQFKINIKEGQDMHKYIYIYIYIYIAKRFSNPRKEGTPCDGDGKRK